MRKYFKANMSKKRFTEQFVSSDKFRKVKERRKLIIEDEKNSIISNIWASEYIKEFRILQQKEK